MILHLGGMMVAAPLVAFGLKRVFSLPGGAPLVWLANAGSLTELAVAWGWHAPALHEAAGQDPRILVWQRASFLAAGSRHIRPGRRGRGYGSRC